MKTSPTKEFLKRFNNAYHFSDTRSAQATADALLRAQQSFYCHSNSGNAKAANQAWLNVETLAYEVEQLVLGGVIQLYEGDL